MSQHLNGLISSQANRRGIKLIWFAATNEKALKRKDMQELNIGELVSYISDNHHQWNLRVKAMFIKGIAVVFSKMTERLYREVMELQNHFLQEMIGGAEVHKQGRLKNKKSRVVRRGNPRGGVRRREIPTSNAFQMCVNTSLADFFTNLQMYSFEDSNQSFVARIDDITHKDNLEVFRSGNDVSFSSGVFGADDSFLRAMREQESRSSRFGSDQKDSSSSLLSSHIKELQDNVFAPEGFHPIDEMPIEDSNFLFSNLEHNLELMTTPNTKSYSYSFLRQPQFQEAVEKLGGNSTRKKTTRKRKLVDTQIEMKSYPVVKSLRFDSDNFTPGLKKKKTAGKSLFDNPFTGAHAGLREVWDDLVEFDAEKFHLFSHQPNQEEPFGDIELLRGHTPSDKFSDSLFRSSEKLGSFSKSLAREPDSSGKKDLSDFPFGNEDPGVPFDHGEIPLDAPQDLGHQNGDLLHGEIGSEDPSLSLSYGGTDNLQFPKTPYDEETLAVLEHLKDRYFSKGKKRISFNSITVKRGADTSICSRTFYHMLALAANDEIELQQQSLHFQDLTIVGH